MTSIIADKNICAAAEKVLGAAGKFALTNQKRDLNPIFVIVPDRFSLQAEKILVKYAKCLIGVRVVTFSMLYNVLQMSDEQKVIDKTTAVLFMWRAIQSVKNDLQYFGNSVNQYAFAEKMFNTINQLTSCTADFNKLESNASSDITRRKMHDIALVQKAYKELIGEKIDGSGVLGWLIDNVGLSPVIRDSHVYIVGFEYLSIQREEVIKRIMNTARSVTVGVREDSELHRRLNEIRFAM